MSMVVQVRGSLNVYLREQNEQVFFNFAILRWTKALTRVHLEETCFQNKTRVHFVSLKNVFLLFTILCTSDSIKKYERGRKEHVKNGHLDR